MAASVSVANGSSYPATNASYHPEANASYYAGGSDYGPCRTRSEIQSMILSDRRLPDMIMRSNTLYIACFYAYGHLLGLQGNTARKQRNMIITCLLFPLLPAVLLLRDVFDSFLSYFEHVRRPGPRTWSVLNWEYHVSGALGIQAEAHKLKIPDFWVANDFYTESWVGSQIWCLVLTIPDSILAFHHQKP